MRIIRMSLYVFNREYPVNPVKRLGVVLDRRDHGRQDFNRG